MNADSSRRILCRIRCCCLSAVFLLRLFLLPLFCLGVIVLLYLLICLYLVIIGRSAFAALVSEAGSVLAEPFDRSHVTFSRSAVYHDTRDLFLLFF